MILTGPEIKKQVELGRIVIDGFDESRLTPNSYDFSLGNSLKVYRNDILDPRIENPTIDLAIPEQGLLLQPAKLYLGFIQERIGSEYYVPIIKGRSSIGRIGLFVNITSDLVDQGAFGQWSLQFSATQPVRVYPGMKIGQMTFWHTMGDPMLYQGKYQDAVGPCPSKSWVDFQQD